MQAGENPIIAVAGDDYSAFRLSRTEKVLLLLITGLTGAALTDCSSMVLVLQGKRR